MKVNKKISKKAIKRFFGIPFWQSFLAGLLSGLIVSTSFYSYIKKAMGMVVRVTKGVVKSAVVTSPDGTSYYNYRGPKGEQYFVIEEKNGKKTFIYKGPLL